MIAHRNGRVIVIAEDRRKPIRLAPRPGRALDDILAAMPAERRERIAQISAALMAAPSGGIGV